MRVVRRASNIVAGLAMIGGLGYCTYIYSSAESRVSEVCARIVIGSDVVELRRFSEENGMTGLRESPPENGMALIVEEKTYGRYGCRVELEGGKVKTVEHSFAL